MGLIDGKGADDKNLGSKLDLAEKMRAYTLQRRIRVSGFVFIAFGLASIIPLLVIPFFKMQQSGITPEWMILFILFLCITNLLMVFGMLFMLYAVLNTLENR